MNNESDIRIFCSERDALLKQLLDDGKIIVLPNGTRKFNSLEKHIVKNYDIGSLLERCNSKTFGELLYCLLNDDTPYNHMCPVCGEPCGFSSKQFHGTCRKKQCLCELLLRNDNIKSFHQFILDNYLNGDKEFHCSRIGFIEKYHVFSNSQLGHWKTTIQTAWSSKTKDDLERRKLKTIETCRRKYGHDWSQQSQEIKDKQIRTWQLKSEDELRVKNERRIATTNARYHVDHVMKSKEILESVRERHFQENGYYHWLQKKVEHKDIYLDDEKFKEYILKLYSDNGNQRVKKTELDRFFNIDVKNRCSNLNLMKYIQVFTSEMEEQFKKLFDDNHIKYIWRCRSIVDGVCGKSHCYELDFYLPDHNIGIEINDLSNHNSIVRSDKPFGNRYHLYKSENCKSKGIRLIHIWEWEIKKDFVKISNWLLNELNNAKKNIFARKCSMRPVSIEEEKTFLNEFHLQGYAKSSHCLGLYAENELVQLMSFTKSRFSKKYEYELLRLCTKNGISVVGGSQRLFKHFISEVKPKSIVSYCDFSKFSGNVYNRIGMTFDKLSNPTITYCNWDMRTINESLLMKLGADKLLNTNYGIGVNNQDIMIKEGFLPVHNCGNLIFTWNEDKRDER